MENDGTTRKLAAILSADVKEYSRLMSQDERGTIRTLTDYKEAMSKLIVEYKGSHLYTSDESKEKRAVGQLWQDLSEGKGIFMMPTRRNYESIRQAIT